jgi:hypothetical protein
VSGTERATALRRLVPSIRNVVAGYAGTAAEAVVFLLLTPFLVRKLGLEDFGLWGGESASPTGCSCWTPGCARPS